MPKQSLTIFLVKDSYSHDDACIRQDEIASLDNYPMTLEGASYARLYLRKNRPKKPSWCKLFPAIDWSKYRTNTYSGLLIVDVSHRRFAIAGGSGRYLLDPFAIEEGFGFKTVVNSVDPTTIRKIEKKTINQNPMNSIEQLTRTSGLHDFQVDYYTDIISKIRAKSSIIKLGTVIDGRDSLQISIDSNADQIPEALAECLAAYNSDAYLEHFPNIDNISIVDDRELTRALDDELIQRLNEGEHDQCWAAMPEILHEEDFDCFQYSRRGNALRYHDIELAHCLEKYRRKGKRCTKADLERDEIYIRTLDGNIYPRWRIWKCLYAEVVRSDRLYILIEGKWYRVSQEFVERLDEQILGIQKPGFTLDNWKQQEREQVYLRRLGDRFVVLDSNFVQIDGQAPIELCDLLFPERTFIHVKRYGSSEVLSHLFNQGRVAAKLILRDRRFRVEARRKLGDYAPFDSDRPPDARLYQVVFFIGSKYGQDQPLPLFAKVVLVDVYNELVSYGFDVRLGFIQVDPI